MRFYDFPCVENTANVMTIVASSIAFYVSVFRKYEIGSSCKSAISSTDIDAMKLFHTVPLE
jgi:hypothetical protein